MGTGACQEPLKSRCRCENRSIGRAACRAAMGSPRRPSTAYTQLPTPVNRLFVGEVTRACSSRLGEIRAPGVAEKTLCGRGKTTIDTRPPSIHTAHRGTRSQRRGLQGPPSSAHRATCRPSDSGRRPSPSDALPWLTTPSYSCDSTARNRGYVVNRKYSRGSAPSTMMIVSGTIRQFPRVCTTGNS